MNNQFRGGTLFYSKKVIRIYFNDTINSKSANTSVNIAKNVGKFSVTIITREMCAGKFTVAHFTSDYTDGKFTVAHFTSDYTDGKFTVGIFTSVYTVGKFTDTHFTSGLYDGKFAGKIKGSAKALTK